MHSYGTENVFLGAGAGNFTTSSFGDNVGIGARSLETLTTGYENNCVGIDTGVDITTGIRNNLIGRFTGYRLQDGSNNNAVG